MQKEIKCWVCNNEMEYIETVEVQILGGKCEKYKCTKCDEIIYNPLSRF